MTNKRADNDKGNSNSNSKSKGNSNSKGKCGDPFDRVAHIVL
jgi:hypothetical protein